VASGERTFTVLRVKNSYRSAVGRDRLSGFATLSITVTLHESQIFLNNEYSFTEKDSTIICQINIQFDKFKKMKFIY
jgi:hypothetical protein